MNKIFIILSLISLFVFSLQAQHEEERREKITINGQVFSAIISGTDTIIMADLEDISVSSPRKFKDRAEYRKYRKYRYYSVKVYPYAAEAIKIFREMEYATQNMKPRKRKKYVKKLYKDLKDEFKEPMKNLTKTQGKIMIKMIERELGRPFYDLVKELRGGFTAGYWNQLGKFYDYDLKRGYIVGDDPILDAVMNDFDISYDLN